MPDKEDKELINYKLFSEIELGIFNDDTREILIGIIEKMVREQHIDSLILGCTELLEHLLQFHSCRIWQESIHR